MAGTAFSELRQRKLSALFNAFDGDPNRDEWDRYHEDGAALLDPLRRTALRGLAGYHPAFAEL